MSDMKSMLLIATGALIASGCSSAVDPYDAEEWRVGETRVEANEPATPAESTELASAVEFAVHAPAGVPRSQLLFSAQDAVIIGDGADLRAPDLSHQTTVFGMAAVGVESGATLGSVYGGQVSIDEGATLAGRVHTLSDQPAPADTYRWQVSFDEPTAPALTLDNEKTTTLQPGAYESLRVRAGAAAVLGTGVYHFGALDLEENGVLELDNSNGPVMVWLRDGLRVAGTLVHDSPAPNVLVGYAGTETPEITSAFRGVLVAPNATLHLPAAQSPHVGSFFAETIEVDSGAVIYQVPFTPNAVDYSVLPSEGESGSGDGWTNPLQFKKAA
jgi:hypothetical protein